MKPGKAELLGPSARLSLLLSLDEEDAGPNPWLSVELSARHGSLAWSAVDSSLSLQEAKALVVWLESETPEPFETHEGCLGFARLGDGLEIALDLEFLPPEEFETQRLFFPGRKGQLDFAAELAAQLAALFEPENEGSSPLIPPPPRR